MSKVSSAVRQFLTHAGLHRSAWLPQQLLDDDVFLITYPKSGTTWLRFQIGYLLQGSAGEEIDFHNCHRLVPSIGSPQEQQLASRPRVLSSHAPYQREFNKVIYVVRDGRDVYVSYYHHLQQFLPPDTTFSQFLKSRKIWPCRWSNHVTGWLTNSAPGQLLLVRYEDMLADGVDQLRRVADFIGIEATTDDLKNAVARSTFDAMQKTESKKGRFKPESGPKQFVRKGIAGDWKNTFTATDLRTFNRLDGPTLDWLNHSHATAKRPAA